MNSPADRGGVAQLKVLLEYATARLRVAGVDSPRLDAELLFAFAAGVTREALFATAIVLDDALRDRYAILIGLRASRKPLAYIVGGREFYSLKFEVSPEVLIPRPETELLVAAALEVVASRPAASVLDLGTGSGAIALAIAANAPHVHVTATDVSASALAIAARNATRHALDTRVEFRLADCWEVLDGGDALGHFDLIVANPPYVRNDEIALLAPEIRAFEPRLALAGGPDGLDFYRRITDGVRRHLAPDGTVIVEVGEGQAGDVATFFRARGFDNIALLKDFANIQRVIRVHAARFRARIAGPSILTIMRS
jgi:release factor glutamine methyltransferase